MRRHPAPVGVARTHTQAGGGRRRRGRRSPSVRPAAEPRGELAIVIPTLDEAETIAGIVRWAAREAERVVVSDGGSTDGTPELARAAGAIVVEGPPGRGGQLARGAAAAEGVDILLFLHADTRLPDGAGREVRRAVAGGATGGGFRVRFDSPRPLVQLLGSRLVNLRTRWTRCPLGDQAQFATADAFRAAGGFPDWPLFEDLELARRLKRRGRIEILPLVAVTSARRFERLGVARTIATNWLLLTLYLLGVAPERLARIYRRGVSPPPRGDELPTRSRPEGRA